MFLPLHDDNPLRVIRVQYVTAALIALNVLVFLWTGAFSNPDVLDATLVSFGLVPAEILDFTRVPAGALNPVAEPLTLLSHMFLHASWMHLMGNMLFLWVFSDNVEDAFGYIGFILFYILSGLGAAGLYVWVNAGSHAPMVGASGAVSGVLAAYLVLYPKARVLVLAFMVLPLRLPAWVVLGFWIGLQALGLFSVDQESQSVAWWAHIGGLATGLVLTLLLRSRLLVRD